MRKPWAHSDPDEVTDRGNRRKRARATSVASAFLPLFRPAQARSAEIHGQGVRLRYRNCIRAVPLRRITSIDSATRLGFATLTIESANGAHTLPGLRPRAAAAFVSAIEDARAAWWRNAAAGQAANLRSLQQCFDLLRNGNDFVAAAAFERLRDIADACMFALSGDWPEHLAELPEFRTLNALARFLDNPQYVRDAANERYIARELADSRGLFERIESRPLTDEQRRAIVIDDRRNLVIASAGSGKTSVIVGKAAWLIRKGHRQPSEILLLAFARDARAEMEHRIASRLGASAPQGLAVQTFHALGLSVLRHVDGETATLSGTADDPAALNALIKEIVTGLLADPTHSANLLNWLQNRFEPVRSEWEFSNLGEYYNYVRQFDLRTLRGEKVKSLGECDIANYLFLNGIPYRYEAPYEHDTATVAKRQYRPDFHLPRHGIYIEHFGLDSRGRPPPYVDADTYLRERVWKLELHGKHGTDLIQTFSHQHVNGILPRALANELAKRGIPLVPIPTDEVFSVLEEQGRIDPFIRLAATFLHHFKSARLTYQELSARIAATRARERGEAFLAVFRPIAERYTQVLHERGQIDFNDMIHRAADLVETGHYRNPYTYILIDEFQDISPARARLLKALVGQSPGNRLFAVGDDWQAISRYAGSDISIMREFEEHFGPAAQLRLETTFRCPDRLATLATDFVLRNPAQIPKTVRSTRRAAGPCVHVGLAPAKDRPLLDEALALIAADATAAQGKPEILLLARYNRLKPDIRALRKTWPNLAISFRTVHASKGMEADYVVLLGLNGGQYAFPTEIVDDPLLDLVLSRPETVANAEERRLFYVALTRARRHVFLIAGDGRPSSFATELVHGGYDITLFGSQPAPDTPCPVCVEGRLELRDNPRGGDAFYGCSNYPLCKHAQPGCPGCKTGLPTRRDRTFHCADCDLELQPCPQCTGWLQPRAGRAGDFLGCSNYPACDYTRSIGHAAGRARGPGRGR